MYINQIKLITNLLSLFETGSCKMHYIQEYTGQTTWN